MKEKHACDLALTKESELRQKMMKVRNLLDELKQHPEADKSQALQALAQKHCHGPFTGGTPLPAGTVHVVARI